MIWFTDHSEKSHPPSQEGAADVFGSGGGNGGAQPAVDLKSLHAKIGELTQTGSCDQARSRHKFVPQSYNLQLSGTMQRHRSEH